MEKCYVCGEDISIEDGDMFYTTTDNNYICGCHGIRTNRLVLNAEVIEKILEEKFGGVAVIRGEANFIINYD